MPLKSKRARTVNLKIPLQDGATSSNSSPQEVHQKVEQGAIGPNINMLYEMIQKTQTELAEIAKHVKKTKTTDEGLQHKPLPEKNQHEKENNEGSALEHVSKFLDAVGPHVGDSNLCLREYFKSLTDQAYTCVKQKAGERLLDFIKQFQDIALDCYVNHEERELIEICIDNMLPDYRAHLENLDIAQFTQLLQKAQKTAISVKTVERSRADKRSTLHAFVVTSNNDTRNKKKGDGTLDVTQIPQGVQRNPLPNQSKERGAVSVVNHAETEDTDEELEDSLSTNPAAIKTLQRSPKFWSLFNQLGLGPDARKAAIEAIINIAAGSGSQCYTAEAHASRAFLETTNIVTFIDEDMEVHYPDHWKSLYVAAMINGVHILRALVDNEASLNLIPTSTLDAAGISRKKIQGIPMEVIGFGGAAEYTVGHIQLVLKVGPIVALTRFHVVNTAVSYHALLGRPWLIA
uniref:Retrotransposon gag domain-containing protein n=1 Tax=Fagus sylvatica TaxID=28930 RepID=A0A2N9G276_FAGSY